MSGFVCLFFFSKVAHLTFSSLCFTPLFMAKFILLEKILTRAGVSSKVDDSTQTVGKRYARTDECGIPYALTVDFDTLKD